MSWKTYSACAIPECRNSAGRDSFCWKHYRNLMRFGTAEIARTATEERFWEKVEKTDTCWLWLGALGHFGHGTFKVEGKTVKAHRYAYELLIGSIPDGLVLDHVCQIPPCVNPDHLEPVTQRENVQRGSTPPANNARKELCLNGHVFSTENTRFDPKTKHRICRTCARETMREIRAEIPRVGMRFNNGNALKNACKFGHPFDGENLMLTGKQRRCRICHNATSLRNARKRRERLQSMISYSS